MGIFMQFVIPFWFDVADRSVLPKVGDVIHVSSLGKKVTVLKVNSSKGELVVQAGIMKLKLKLTDIHR